MSKIADPEWRRWRARKAALTRTTIDHHIDRIVAAAPTLTREQRDRLAVILRGYRLRRSEGRPVA